VLSSGLKHKKEILPNIIVYWSFVIKIFFKNPPNCWSLLCNSFDYLSTISHQPWLTAVFECNAFGTLVDWIL